MARLLDIEDNLADLDPEAIMNLNEQGTEPVQIVQDTPEPETEDDIPEKYRGKSARELIRMHQEAEKAYGRKGSEVGELRKLVDSYITTQLVESKPQPKAVEEDEDLNIFTDPEKFLDKKLTNHPAIKALEEQRVQTQRASNQAALEQKHPDFREVIQDQAFVEWVQGSKTRTRLFIEADRGYDADAADELLTTWKEKKALASATVAAGKALRKEDIKKASTGGARGSQTPPSKKMYRRSDLINLSINDPRRYAQLSDEILLAYAEKRVI